MHVYVFNAALLCEGCGDKVRAERVRPGHVNEADTPQHCEGCGVFLENPLTSDGRAYVLDSITRLHRGEGGSRAVLKTWAAFYGFNLSRGGQGRKRAITY